MNQILLYHFRKDKILADKDRLERLTLETAIIRLYTYSVIDKLTYAKLFQEDYAISICAGIGVFSRPALRGRKYS